jgi:drug/metabolite transporter (DMT)-like permease
LALAAVALISYVPSDGNEGSRTRQAIGLGLVSGLGYGFADICLGLMSAETGEGGLVVARLTSMVLAIALLVHCVKIRLPAGSVDYLHWQGRIGGGLGSDQKLSIVNRPPEGTWNLSIVGVSLCFAAGLLDCIGQFGFVLAATRGQISIAAALVALYPAITIGLGIWLFREPLSRLRALGLTIGFGSLTLLTT